MRKHRRGAAAHVTSSSTRWGVTPVFRPRLFPSHGFVEVQERAGGAEGVELLQDGEFVRLR